MDTWNARPTLEIVVPVYNEERSLETSVNTLVAYLRETFSMPWCVTIADNASTDNTPFLAASLASEIPEVRVMHLAEKGRGRALRTCWLASEADIVAYVDVDLSTDLRALQPLVAPLVSGHSDIAIGTRLSASSRVVRGAKRETISRCYNLLIRRTMGVSFSDAQCGFKAMRADVAQVVLPLVTDNEWFFDTELLVLAERAGLRIAEVPVDWIDDPDSKVDIVQTATADLRGLWRVQVGMGRGTIPVDSVYEKLGRKPLAVAAHSTLVQQIMRFAAVGVCSTLAYALLYLVLAGFWPAQLANVVSLLVTAVLNTWANRRFTFGITELRGRARHQLQGLLVFLLAWAMTSGSLLTLHATAPEAGAGAELAVLTAANLVATIVRFVLLRAWVFHQALRKKQEARAAGEDAAHPIETADAEEAEPTNQRPTPMKTKAEAA